MFVFVFVFVLARREHPDFCLDTPDGPEHEYLARHFRSLEDRRIFGEMDSTSTTRSVSAGSIVCIAKIAKMIRSCI